MSVFTRYRHPVLAVACPSCRAKVGAWCKRPSGHKARHLHRKRGRDADRLWLEEGAPFLAHEGGRWIVREPRTVSERRGHEREVENTRFILEHFT